MPRRPIADADLSYYQALELAVTALLTEKQVFSADEMRRQIEAMDARHPGLGGRLVARAWVDPAYKARALADGSAAAREIGLEVGPLKLIVVENTDAVHNLVVCTLCSCYPPHVAGPAP